MYMFMELRHCPIRIILPTDDNQNTTPEWSDVAFAYIRELHRFDQTHPGVLPNVVCRVQGFSMVDFDREESRWYPYQSWFLGKSPEPGTPAAPTCVNLVIGAGDNMDFYFTPGCVNILITGFGIPPYKLNWITDTAWQYDAILTMTAKHSEVIDDLREKARDLAKQRVNIAGESGKKPELADVRLATNPSKMTIVIPPKPATIGQLVETLKSALEKCVPESERSYG